MIGRHVVPQLVSSNARAKCSLVFLWTEHFSESWGLTSGLLEQQDTCGLFVSNSAQTKTLD